MPVNGRNTQILVNEFDLSTYFRSAEMSGEAGVLDSTTFRASDKTCIPDLIESGISLSGLWDADQFHAVNNPSGLSNKVDDILDPILGVDTNQLFMVGLQGLDAFGVRVRFCQGKETKYSVTSPLGLVSCMAEVKADGPLHSGILLAHQVARTTSASGTAHDNGAATSLGAKAQIHCTAASASDTLDVIVEDSADNVDFDTIGTFTQLSVVGSQMISIAGAIRRYTRMSWTIAGTGPSFTFAGALARNRF